MRMKNFDTEKKVDETLALLDSIPKNKANPFFYTRLKARMESQSETKRGIKELVHVRLLILVIGLLLLILVNTYSVLNLSSRSTQVTKEQGLESFAESYNLTHSKF
jgi:hypothetical protein